MKATRILASTIVVASLAAAAFTVAAGEAQPTSRAEAKALVLQARADGTLMRGEAVPYAMVTSGSQLSRQQVRDEVMVARASGEMMPAGEGRAPEVASYSMLARAEVREEVREARARGELMPAGEGLVVIERMARPTSKQRDQYAANSRR